jgi:hypothetical protein
VRVRVVGTGHETGWADRERDYLVLYIFASQLPGSVAVLTDDGFDAALPMADIEITDPLVPHGWTVSASPAGIDIGPPEFHSKDFWNQLGGERSADDDGTWQQPTYRRVVMRLVDEVGTDGDRAAIDAMPPWGEDAESALR